MAKQKDNPVGEVGAGEYKGPRTGTPHVPKTRVEVLTDEAVINGYELRAGTVIELPDDEIENHRSHGVCLGAVADDDMREVFDVSSPPSAA